MSTPVLLGDYENPTHRGRRYLRLVIVLLFITGCLGFQIFYMIATSASEDNFLQVRVAANSAADYGVDEKLYLAPISPDILEDIEQDDAYLIPTPILEPTQPAIGQVIPTQTTAPGGTSTSMPPSGTITATSVGQTETPASTTQAPTVPFTPTPQTPAGTLTPTTPVATTRVPTTSIPTTAVPTTPVPTTRVPTTPVPTTAIPTTRVPTTAVPTTRVPTTAVPTTGVPTTAVPTTAVPTTAVPPTPIPATPTPMPSGVYTLVPTINFPTLEPPGPTEEPFPPPGLDVTPQPVLESFQLPLIIDIHSLAKTKLLVCRGS